MSEKKLGAAGGRKNVFRFSVAGLLGFALALVLATGGLTGGALIVLSKPKLSNAIALTTATPQNEISVSDKSALNLPPWGELIVHDVELERPREYVSYEADPTYLGAPAWHFGNLEREQVRAVLTTSGLTTAQIEDALSPNMVTFNGRFTIKPDDNLIFSLSPEVRANLYRELARDPANLCMRYPYRFTKADVDRWFGNSRLSDAAMDEIKKLIYVRGGLECFSDFEMMVRRLPSAQVRLEFVSTLSRMPVSMVRVQIGSGTDIDKLLRYWERGLQGNDIRPLLESLKRVPGGGNISLMYLLPQSARELLYTFQFPFKPGDPIINCHWSTMNFFNSLPDNSMADPGNMLRELGANFQKLAKATRYGDVILIRNSRGEVLHSAVYLADDIVYTKNGGNFSQPWALMHVKDVVNQYTLYDTPQIEAYRRNSF